MPLDQFDTKCLANWVLNSVAGMLNYCHDFPSWATKYTKARPDTKTQKHLAYPMAQKLFYTQKQIIWITRVTTDIVDTMNRINAFSSKRRFGFTCDNERAGPVTYICFCLQSTPRISIITSCSKKPSSAAELWFASQKIMRTREYLAIMECASTAGKYWLQEAPSDAIADDK